MVDIDEQSESLKLGRVIQNLLEQGNEVEQLQLPDSCYDTLMEFLFTLGMATGLAARIKAELRRWTPVEKP